MVLEDSLQGPLWMWVGRVHLLSSSFCFFHLTYFIYPNFLRSTCMYWGYYHESILSLLCIDMLESCIVTSVHIIISDWLRITSQWYLDIDKFFSNSFCIIYCVISWHMKFGLCINWYQQYGGNPHAEINFYILETSVHSRLSIFDLIYFVNTLLIFRCLPQFSS